MCFSVNQIDDLQTSNKKQSWTFRLPFFKTWAEVNELCILCDCFQYYESTVLIRSGFYEHTSPQNFSLPIVHSCCHALANCSFFENSQYMPDFVGFQYKVILDLYRILFRAVVIFGPEHDFLFKSASTYCDSKL